MIRVRRVRTVPVTKLLLSVATRSIYVIRHSLSNQPLMDVERNHRELEVKFALVLLRNYLLSNACPML
jgi:hypothetical protein